MESKSITIEGKVARYRMRKLEPPAPPKLRKAAETWTAIADNQLETLRQGTDTRMSSEISRKLCGYRQQDKSGHGSSGSQALCKSGHGSSGSQALCKSGQPPYGKQALCKSGHGCNDVGLSPIGLQSTIDLLVASELRCCYCRQEVLVLYELVREKQQWTLDRIDNNRGHTADNVVIACLECNLKRRRVDNELFTFTRQLVVCKND
jgi:hypothetical protein